MLYKYANVSVLESECPDSTGPARARCPSRWGFDSAGALPLLAFFFSIIFFFFDISSMLSPIGVENLAFTLIVHGTRCP